MGAEPVGTEPAGTEPADTEPADTEPVGADRDSAAARSAAGTCGYIVGMRELKVQVEVPAPVEAVWARFTDPETWEQWSGLDEVVVRQPGSPAPGGLGMIRVLRQSGIAIEEEITVYEPPTRLGFQWVAGLPARACEGEVYFRRGSSGTVVEWRLAFRPWIPGTAGLLAGVLERAARDSLERLAASSFSSADARPAAAEGVGAATASRP